MTATTTDRVLPPFVRTKMEINHAGLIVGQCGIAACFEGPPGVGKTKTLQALADCTNRQFYSYELSRTQPEDLQGFPIVDELHHLGVTHKYMRFVPDERLLRAGLRASLLLMDEITNVGPAKQAPALNLIQNGVPGAWMYMACNPEESAADGQPLTCPFINRIWYGEWEVDREAQLYGMRNGCQYPSPDIPLVTHDFMRYQPHWASLACDYLRHHPSDFNNCPKNQEKHKPWPSSRTWEYTTIALAGAQSVNASLTVMDSIAVGLLGGKVGNALIAHIKQLSLPQAEDVLNTAKTFKFPARYDILQAVMEMVLSYIKDCPVHDQPRVHEQAVVLMERLKSANEEMGTLFAGGLRLIVPSVMQAYDAKSLAAITKALEQVS